MHAALHCREYLYPIDITAESDKREKPRSKVLLKNCILLTIFKTEKPGVTSIKWPNKMFLFVSPSQQ